MFYILCKHYNEGKHLKGYPVGLMDEWGDILFLPLFNGLAIYLLEAFNPFIAAIATLISLIMTSIFVKWRRDIAHHNDWSRPRKYVFNNGAWYHSAYMFFQAAFVFYALILHYNQWILWTPLSGYVILGIIRLIQVHEKVDEF